MKKKTLAAEVKALREDLTLATEAMVLMNETITMLVNLANMKEEPDPCEITIDVEFSDVEEPGFSAQDLESFRAAMFTPGPKGDAEIERLTKRQRFQDWAKSK